MTAPWLSTEWIALAGREASDLVGASSLTGRVVVEVTGVPGGDVSGHAVFAEGRLVSSGAGPTEEADVTLTLTDADARALVAGDLTASVAFMQGRMKVLGSMGVVLDLLALTATDAARLQVAEVAAQTEF